MVQEFRDPNPSSMDNSPEQELQRMQKRMDSLAHDLRNPLAVAQQYTSIAQDAEDEEALTRVENSLDRISVLIETRLEDSLAEASEKALAETAFEDNIEQAWYCVDTKNATLETRTGDEPFHIRVENSHICSILENLFRNAVEHGGSDVTVTVGRLRNTHGFYVADNGPGVQSPCKEAIFDDGVSTGDGPGIGLSIVKMLSDLYEWQINVTESDSGGARFEFVIPQSD